MARHDITTSTDGRPAFRKSGVAGRQLRAEAQGLAALADTGAVRVPELFAVDDLALLTERIECGPATPAGWERLGRQLATLHGIPQVCFGFVEDNFCGDTPQPNPRMTDGHAFFAEHRLIYQGRMAYDAGLLEPRDLQALEQLCGRLPALVPGQGPALLHGDLWNGNVLFDPGGDPGGDPVLIDPACYWGWPEAEIAMCELFGGFTETFYRSWEDALGPEAGWRERLPIYQLYHLLNHLNLFGGGYHGSVKRVLQRFS